MNIFQLSKLSLGGPNFCQSLTRLFVWPLEGRVARFARYFESERKYFRIYPICAKENKHGTTVDWKCDRLETKIFISRVRVHSIWTPSVPFTLSYTR